MFSGIDGLFFYFLLSVCLVLVLGLLSFLLVERNRDAEKGSSYECGFCPFGSTRQRFEVQYYIVAILFLVFDVEIALLLPWICVLGQVGYFVFFVGIVFVILLFVGLLYEFSRKETFSW